MKVISDSPDKTILIGRLLGSRLEPGSVVCLEGNLGAGKTHLAKGVALGLGVEDHVTSPTFTIINEYEGRLPLYHVDAYRLEEEDEAYELGLEEYLYGNGVTLIEWPDRIRPLIPREHLTVSVRMSGTEDDTRELELTSAGTKYERLVTALQPELAACSDRPR